MSRHWSGNRKASRKELAVGNAELEVCRASCSRRTPSFKDGARASETIVINLDRCVLVQYYPPSHPAVERVMASVPNSRRGTARDGPEECPRPSNEALMLSLLARNVPAHPLNARIQRSRAENVIPSRHTAIWFQRCAPHPLPYSLSAPRSGHRRNVAQTAGPDPIVSTRVWSKSSLAYLLAGKRTHPYLVPEPCFGSE